MKETVNQINDWNLLFNKPVCQLDHDGAFVRVTTADLDVYAKDGSYLIPAGCVDAPPPEIKAGQAAKWLPESQAWTYLPDHRGEVVYRTDTGEQVEIRQLGELPDNVTSEPRPSPNHTWDGKAWTIPQEIAKQMIQEQFQAAKAAKIQQLNHLAQNFVNQAADTDKLPEFEIQSWALQATEAKAWAEDHTIATPILDKIALARGIAPDVLKQAALRKTMIYEALTAHVAGQRQALYGQIEAAQSLDDLDAITIAFTLPVEN